jgi:hypothetical protein
MKSAKILRRKEYANMGTGAYLPMVIMNLLKEGLQKRRLVLKQKIKMW